MLTPEVIEVWDRKDKEPKKHRRTHRNSRKLKSFSLILFCLFLCVCSFVLFDFQFHISSFYKRSGPYVWFSFCKRKRYAKKKVKLKIKVRKEK